MDFVHVPTGWNLDGAQFKGISCGLCQGLRAIRLR